ncbi:MAG: methyltransferase domain-containing protein [Planctomycetota bacterium]
MPRVITPELMDEPDVPRDELDRSLGFIRFVNRRLGGSAALVSRLAGWSARWPGGKRISLIDLGTGSADIPVAALRWAESAGHDLRITAVDAHATTLDLAREHVTAELGSAAIDDARITFVQADALTLADRFGDRSFHYAHAGMFLHHLSDIRVMTALRVMERLVSAGLVWNDLVRAPISRFGVRLLTARAPEMVKHDARVSVEAGFTSAEIRDIQHRLTLGWCDLSVVPLAGRFVLAGEKHGAWG